MSSGVVPWEKPLCFFAKAKTESWNHFACLLISARKKKSNQTVESFLWALHRVKSSYIVTMNISVCHPSCFPGSFGNPRGENAMVLALRKNWSPSLSSPAPEFAVPKLEIISAKQALSQGCEKHSCQSAAAEQLGSSKQDWVLQHLADNPGTEIYVFSQMFTPPHSSHLPRSPRISSSSPGFPHPPAHNSGVFCTDFLSLLSRDSSSAQIYHVISFICHSSLSSPLTCWLWCPILAHDLFQQPPTPQRAGQQRNAIPRCPEWAQGVIRCSCCHCLLGISSGSPAGLPLSITSPHGDGSAPVCSPHGSSSWPWHFSVETPHPGVYLTLLPLNHDLFDLAVHQHLPTALGLHSELCHPLS